MQKRACIFWFALVCLGGCIKKKINYYIYLLFGKSDENVEIPFYKNCHGVDEVRIKLPEQKCYSDVNMTIWVGMSSLISFSTQ